MLRDSVVVVVVRTRSRAIPLAMITMTKSTHGFPFISHIWVAYGAQLGGPSGRRSSAMKLKFIIKLRMMKNMHYHISLGNCNRRFLRTRSVVSRILT